MFCRLFLFVFVLLPSLCQACTGLMLKARDGSFVHGRTLEFGVKINTSIAVIPRGYEFVGTSPKGPGLKYKSKYAAVGAFSFDNPVLMDGLNEKGLAVGTFYFPEFAGYTEITAENQGKALSPIEFSNWLLTQFATIDEVKAGLDSVVIAPTVVKEWGPEPAPFHYIVSDKKGNCLVIEPIKGQLKTYDNPIGVLTNSPTFDWHMANLRNFINLRAVNAPPLKIEGLELAQFGQGSGLLGLPGDFTPPSRFVQATVFQITAIPTENAQTAIEQILHILNHFDIPVGASRDVVNGVTYTDYTQLTCAKDPQNLKYFFRTYDDQTIRVVDLTQFDLDAAKIKSINTKKFDSQNIINITKDFK